MSQDSYETCGVCGQSKIQDVVMYCSYCQESVCEDCNSEYPDSYDCGNSVQYYCRKCVGEHPNILERRKCKNYEICGEEDFALEMDKRVDPHMCFECWAYRGELKKTAELSECSVCMDENQLIQLSCHETHRLCLECWDKTIKSKPSPSKCPICMTQIGAWKVNVS